MERLVRNVMLDYLTANRLISSSQHGFVPSKSCVTNLLETIDLLTEAASEHIVTAVVLLEFAKAFDKVCHVFMPIKLAYAGFTLDLINWITAFLTNRRQRVIISKASSDWCQVRSGVPQDCYRPTTFPDLY